MMISSKKKYLKKALKVSAIVIIIFVTVSMFATMFVYDAVFKRYDAPQTQSDFVESAPLFKSRKTYSYSCGSHNLFGYLYESAQPSSDLIIIVPGFHSESVQYMGLIQAFSDLGFNVFSFDSTGHGDSGGKSSVGFPQIINDLNATLKFIKDSSEFAYDDIFLFGHSRGGYAACCVLNEHEDISAAVSVNAVDCAMDGIMAYSCDAIGKIAYGNYPFLWLYQTVLFGTDVADRSAVEEINQSRVPVLVIQAENDKKLYQDGFSLYSHRDEIYSDNAEFILYSKDGHSGHTTILYDKDGRANYDIIESVSAFFKENANKGEIS